MTNQAPAAKVTRQFLGKFGVKTSDFSSKSEKHFEDKHLRAYLAGHDVFFHHNREHRVKSTFATGAAGKAAKIVSSISQAIKTPKGVTRPGLFQRAAQKVKSLFTKTEK